MSKFGKAGCKAHRNPRSEFADPSVPVLIKPVEVQCRFLILDGVLSWSPRFFLLHKHPLSTSPHPVRVGLHLPLPAPALLPEPKHRSPARVQIQRHSTSPITTTPSSPTPPSSPSPPPYTRPYSHTPQSHAPAPPYPPPPATRTGSGAGSARTRACQGTGNSYNACHRTGPGIGWSRWGNSEGGPAGGRGGHRRG